MNFRDRANRARANSSSSLLAYLYPSTWLDLEPYQNPDDSSWGRGSSAGHVEPNDAISPKDGGQNETLAQKKKRSWHLHKKIRKVAKLEVSDAFEMRGRFIAGMLAMTAIGSIVLFMSAKWIFMAAANAFFDSKQ